MGKMLLSVSSVEGRDRGVTSRPKIGPGGAMRT